MYFLFKMQSLVSQKTIEHLTSDNCSMEGKRKKTNTHRLSSKQSTNRLVNVDPNRRWTKEFINRCFCEVTKIKSINLLTNKYKYMFNVVFKLMENSRKKEKNRKEQSNTAFT